MSEHDDKKLKSESVIILNKFTKPLSPIILPSNDKQIGYSLFVNIPRIQWSPRVILEHDTVQDIVELTLPCLGVWLINVKFNILMLNSGQSTISFQNYYVTNNDPIQENVIVAYSDSTTKILDQGNAFTIGMSDIYIAGEYLLLTLKSTILFEGSIPSMVNIAAGDRSTINQCVLRATRIG